MNSIKRQKLERQASTIRRLQNRYNYFYCNLKKYPNLLLNTPDRPSVNPKVSGLSAKTPTDKTPTTPPNKCTEVAEIGSSTPNLQKIGTVMMVTKAAKAPTNIASHALKNGQPPVEFFDLIQRNIC